MWYGPGTKQKDMSSDDNMTLLSSGQDNGESWRLRGVMLEADPNLESGFYGKRRKSQRTQNLDRRVLCNFSFQFYTILVAAPKIYTSGNAKARSGEHQGVTQVCLLPSFFCVCLAKDLFNFFPIRPI